MSAPATDRASAATEPAAEAWRLLFRLWCSHRPRMNEILASGDLSPMQAMTLSQLDPDEPRPMGELARTLACDNSNVTGIVDRLEERGLVERRAAPNDRRVKMLVLTPAGAELRARHRERMAVPPDAIASLSGADQAALCAILQRALGEGGA